MFVPGQNQLLANLSLLLFLRIFRSFVFMILKRTFEECVSLFSYQRSFFALPFVSNSFTIISCCFLLVKKFFQLFLKLFLFLSCSNSDILSHPTGCCQELFLFLFDSFVISVRSLRRNSDRIPLYTWFVNSYFHVFYFFANNQNIRFFMSFIPFPLHSPLPVSLPFPAVPDLPHNRNTGPPVASSG